MREKLFPLLCRKILLKNKKLEEEINLFFLEEIEKLEKNYLHFSLKINKELLEKFPDITSEELVEANRLSSFKYE